MLAPSPLTYTATADLIEDLPTLVGEVRTRLEISPTDAAAQMGLDPSTLSGFEAGVTEPMRDTIVAVLQWLAEHT